MENIGQLVMDAAVSYGVDPRLALELAIQESGLSQVVRSGAGAIGVMQLMPDTAAWLGVDPYDVHQNIAGGVRYLGMMLNQFGDAAAALAAYNWGPGNVDRAMDRYGAGWLAYAPAETQNHVARIMAGVATEYTSEVALPLPGLPGNGALTLAPTDDFLDGALVLQALLLFMASLLGLRLVRAI